MGYVLARQATYTQAEPRAKATKIYASYQQCNMIKGLCEVHSLWGFFLKEKIIKNSFHNR